LHPRGDERRRASIEGQARKARGILAQQLVTLNSLSNHFAAFTFSHTYIMKTALYLSAAMAVAMTGVDAGVHR
jgi:hypothetical protein